MDRIINGFYDYHRKQSSIDAVGELRQLGIRTMMLTGDNEHTAKAIAEQAGVDGFRATCCRKTSVTWWNV